MNYLSVCDGIGAAHVWHDQLGWECAGTSEIEPFPAAVVEQRYGFKNFGDFTRINRDGGPQCRPVDLLVGGTPCQSFSVAGLRKGLDDPRGNLALEYLALADRLRCQWLVWENVPGVLSVDKGRAFGSFLGALVELGYGYAYRTLDAQHFGVPQRRRRVFVVANLGDWRRPAAVLFERHSLQGHSTPSRKTRERVAAPLTSGAGTGRGNPAGRRQEDDENIVAHSLKAQSNCKHRADSETYIVAPTLDASYATKWGCSSVAKSLCSHGGRFDYETETFVTHALSAEGHDASEDGTGRGVPRVTAIQERAVCENANAGSDGAGFRDDGQAFTLEARGVPQSVAMAVNFRGRENGTQIELGGEQATAVRAGGGTSSKSHALVHSGVRRLTPRECERLQGFPDDYTLIKFRGKPAKDSPRYRAIGNSMARPVMLWIGQRIDAVDKLK
jgi:DNA (cytosine-5)-methyltransferase 1